MGIQFQDRSALGGTGPVSLDRWQNSVPSPAGLPAMPERAVPRARPEDMAGRPSPQGAARDFASALSTPSDPAAEGNDAEAPTARDPDAEGEPHSRHCDARLGSTDKEPKAGATAAGSAPTAVGTSGVELMDPASGPQSLLPRPCRVLVLLNPRGGKGKAMKLFQSYVQPLLVQADVSFTLMLTGECLSKGVQGASITPPPPNNSLSSPQSGGTTPGSWCRRRSWAAGMRW